MLVRKDIEVTTTHSYQIVYKYRWQCSSSFCGKMYVLPPSLPLSLSEMESELMKEGEIWRVFRFGRHSNSINPSTHGCPCGGKLSGIDKDGNLKKEREKVMVEGEDGKMVETPKKKSPWLEFVAVRFRSLSHSPSLLGADEVHEVDWGT